MAHQSTEAVNNRQDWNQSLIWRFQTGEELPVSKLSKRELLGIVFAVNMLVTKHPKTVWVYTTPLWTAIAFKCKEYFDTSTTARRHSLGRSNRSRIFWTPKVDS